MLASAVLTLVFACSDTPRSPDDSGQPPSSDEDDGQPPPSNDDPLRVATRAGVVAGHTVEGALAFEGIPYGAPPTRFAPSEPALPWDGERDATAPAPACAQLSLGPDATVVSANEDCLRLDVWSRAGAEDLPVMVWFHGGGFLVGQTSDYPGHVLAEDVVLVRVAYRLGPFGFMASVDETGSAIGNAGLSDQQLALRWVRDNIEAFGGNANNVTIFGQSAGGTSVCTHLVAPGSRGLFHRAILQSGTCDLVKPWGQAAFNGSEFIRAAGCDGAPAPLACLRGKSAEELLTLTPLPTTEDGERGLGRFSWGPTVDGTLLSEHPNDSLASGAFAKVPVLLGSNRDEGGFFAFTMGLTELDPEGFYGAIGWLFGADAPAVLDRYPLDDYESPVRAISAVLGDSWFHCPIRRDARALVANGGTVYKYHFVYENMIGFLAELGVVHGAEMPFVFGTTVENRYLLDAPGRPLSKQIRALWTEFARSGNPNFGDDESAWPPYDQSARYLRISTESRVETALRKEHCDFWDAL